MIDMATSTATLAKKAPVDEKPRDPLSRFIARRVAASATSDGPTPTFLRYFQRPVWDFLSDYYFRLEIDGWDRLPDEPSLLVGIPSGGSLTVDAWMLVHPWLRHLD